VVDREPKYGLAVTGIVDPNQIFTKGGARPGDVLLLTKPLGTGVVTTALKGERASNDDVRAAVDCMKLLNRQAAEAARLAGAHAVTDVTGFGLLGHAQEMAGLGQVAFRFNLEALPWLPGAPEYAAAGAFPGGMGRNRAYFEPWVQFAPEIDFLFQDMLWTPETSGGLLAALPAAAVPTFQAHCPTAFVIGEVTPGKGEIVVMGNW
jgi:selenide, water dikinase